MNPLVSVDHVTRRFGSLVAVDDVSLAVEAGELVGLLGANGAGKTTVVRIVLGLLAPSAGSVTLFGRPPSAEARRRLGYVPQGLGLYSDLTPRENLAFVRAVFGRGAVEAPSDYPEQPVGELPLGVQRQVAFAQALDHRPDVLVLDEPTSGVGPLGSTRLWQAVREACANGAGALVTTHNLEDAVQCDRLVVMAGGAVVAQGTAEGIVGDRRTVVVEAPEWSVAFERLHEAGLPVTLAGRTLRVASTPLEVVRQALGDPGVRLSVVPATLEEAFLALVVAAPRLGR